MASTKLSILVTGIAGSLGTRLLPLLGGFDVIGVDTHPPADVSAPLRFEKIDLGQESSCPRIAEILLDGRVTAVVHLAFVVDPLRAGVLDRERMWRINVAGTARVLEAIAEANRMSGHVSKLIHLSSVSVYGPELKRPARENDPLQAHTLTYAIHKKEADLAVQARARDLGDCDVYILRPHIFAGASVQNYMINCVRGTAYGKGRIGKRLERQGSRLPLLFPFGKRYIQHRLQFAHVDDVARTIAWILRRPKAQTSPVILNVAGRGDELTVGECVEIAQAKVKRIPTLGLYRTIVKLLWEWGVTSIPPDAFPYLVGSYTMDTTKLQTMLGTEYEQVVRCTNETALVDSMKTVEEVMRVENAAQA